MSKILVPNFDDISLDNEAANGLNYAFYLKGKFPKLKLTLFTIPGRSTIPWMEELSRIPWIRLGMHGFNHDEAESITKAQLEVMEPFTKLYKGPNWKLDNKELDLLAEKQWTIAVKEKINMNIPMKQWPLTDGRAIHGHCWIKADWERLQNLCEQDTEFKFIEEVI